MGSYCLDGCLYGCPLAYRNAYDDFLRAGGMYSGRSSAIIIRIIMNINLNISMHIRMRIIIFIIIIISIFRK